MENDKDRGLDKLRTGRRRAQFPSKIDACEASHWNRNKLTHLVILLYTFRRLVGAILSSKCHEMCQSASVTMTSLNVPVFKAELGSFI